jgi:hypothetical protein
MTIEFIGFLMAKLLNIVAAKQAMHRVEVQLKCFTVSILKHTRPPFHSFTQAAQIKMALTMGLTLMEIFKI